MLKFDIYTMLPKLLFYIKNPATKPTLDIIIVESYFSHASDHNLTISTLSYYSKPIFVEISLSVDYNVANPMTAKLSFIKQRLSF